MVNKQVVCITLEYVLVLTKFHFQNIYVNSLPEQLTFELLALLAFIALLTVQSSAQTRIHNVILFIGTSNNASHNQVHWLVGTPYLSIKASNENCCSVLYLKTFRG